MFRTNYRRISRSWVAHHPEPRGSVAFYGGALFGLCPILAYEHLLSTLYAASYTVIAVPVPLGLNHYSTALSLLDERDAVLHAVPELRSRPFFWLGHSLGCKIIGLLEALTRPATNTFAAPCATDTRPRRGVMDEPSLLLAPDFSDTRDAVPVPGVPELLDQLGAGVKPTRVKMQARIEQSRLFGLTAIVSFRKDTIAGTASGSPETSDVSWLLQTLRARQPHVLHAEIEGGHFEPVGVRLGRTIYDLDFLSKATVPRELEPLVLKLLGELERRRELVASDVNALQSQPRLETTADFLADHARRAHT